MQLNIGPTQESINANHVYQRNTEEASRNQDEVNWIDIILFFIIPVAWGYFTKDFATPGVEWQQGLFTVGLILSLVVSYLAMPLLRFILAAGMLFVVGSFVLALGYEGFKYFIF